VIHKRFILLLGMLMTSQAAAGQISALQIAPAQKPVAPVIAVFRPDSRTLLAPSFLLTQDRENTFAHISLRFSGFDERDQALERLLPVIKVKTLILTQVSLPLVQLWDGRLELSAFQSTLRTQNVQLGALGYAAMRDFPLPQQNFPGGLRAIHLTGLSLNFHFGRVEGTRRPTHAWRCVPRIVAALLN
jgi:hypothetical protein